MALRDRARIRFARRAPLVADDGDKFPIALNSIVNFRRFPIERLRPGWKVVVGAEETLGLTVPTNDRRRGATFPSQQTFMVRNHRQIPGYHLAFTERFARYRLSRNPPTSELTLWNRRNSLPHAFVFRCEPQVGVLPSTVQRRNAAVVDVVNVRDVGDVSYVHRVELRPVSAPPGIETIARTDGQPADGAETKAKSKTASTESEERNISGRPDRTIAAISVGLTGPPCPRTSIHEPAPVVIRRPSPRFIGNPGPSPIRFPNPAAIAIRRPTAGSRGNPHVAVVGNVRPAPVGIQVFRSHVVTIGARPGLRVANGVVAIIGPAIEIVARRSLGNLRLRVIAGAAHRDHLAFLHARAAFRRGDVRFAFANHHYGLIV